MSRANDQLRFALTVLSGRQKLEKGNLEYVFTRLSGYSFDNTIIRDLEEEDVMMLAEDIIYDRLKEVESDD